MKTLTSVYNEIQDVVITKGQATVEACSDEDTWDLEL